MTYKTNYELWGSKAPSYLSRRPAAMSELDLVLAQTYPHVTLQPNSYCCHCYYDPESEPNSPAGVAESLIMDIRPPTGYGNNGWNSLSRRNSADSRRQKIRSRLRRFLGRDSN